MKKSYLSIVVPCFNESEVIKLTYRRLIEILKNYETCELIFVDDGSSDDTLEILSSIEKEDQIVKVVRLSRNFGHQVAVSAGMAEANGEAIIVIDADLQDPPELIPEMVKYWTAGADVVYGVRKNRSGETGFKIWTAKLFYRIINKLSDIDIPHDAGDFRLIDRKVVTEFLKMPEHDRYVRGMISWIGFNQTPIYYDRAPRAAGKTKYPLRRMIKFALDGIFSFSTKPLQIALYFGVVVSMLSVAGITYALISRLFGNDWIPGWTLLFIAVMFMGGVQLIVIGVIGEYVGRIYGESKKRPLYVKYKK